MLGLFVENGPCFVNPDSNSTYLSDWSWNNEVNMLYLDQPVQVGLSYDGLKNVTLDLLEGDVTLRKFFVFLIFCRSIFKLFFLLGEGEGQPLVGRRCRDFTLANSGSQ